MSTFDLWWAVIEYQREEACGLNHTFTPDNLMHCILEHDYQSVRALEEAANREHIDYYD